MISKPLYAQELRGIWKLLAIFAAVLTMYFTIIVWMFSPEMGTSLKAFEEMMPQLMKIVGMYTSSTTMVGFMAAYLYGFLMQLFPMIFSILVGNRLIAQKVDRGSMAYLLAAPVRRRTVAVTGLCVLVTGIAAIVAYVTILGIVDASIMFPGSLEIGKFLLINVAALCLHLFIGSVCFAASVFAADAKQSVAFGAGIPALMFVLQMLGNAGEQVEAVKYATFFTLFDPQSIAAGSAGSMWGPLALLAGAALLFGASVAVFERKDLHV